MPELRKKPNYYSIFLHLVVVGLMVVTVILSLQVRDLKKARLPSEPDLLKVGEKVPEFSGINLEGKEVLVAYEDSTKKTVLFIFNTTCPACKTNSANWVKLWNERNGDKVSIYPLSFHRNEKNRIYKEDYKLPYEILMPKDSTILLHYKPNAIPLTLVVDYGGRVEMVFAGILSPAQLKDLEGIIR